MFKLCKYNKPLNPLIVICHKIRLSKKQNNNLTFTFYFAVCQLISVKTNTTELLQSPGFLR